MKSTENSDVQLEQIGIVSTIDGQKPIAQAIDGTTRELIAGEPIYLHDVVSTIDNTHIKIILNDDTVFELGPNSNASLDKYIYDPDISGGEFEAFVSSGSFHYISGKISGDNQGQHTLIKTPSAQIGIRGSEITAEISTDGSTTILHMDGLVSIHSNYTLEEILVYERGTSIFIPNDNTSHISNQLTEEQLQYHFQEWQIDYNAHEETEVIYETGTKSEIEVKSETEIEAESDSESIENPEHNNLEHDEPVNDINNQHSPARIDINHHDKPLDSPPSQVDVIGNDGPFRPSEEINKPRPGEKPIIDKQVLPKDNITHHPEIPPNSKPPIPNEPNILPENLPDFRPIIPVEPDNSQEKPPVPNPEIPGESDSSTDNLLDSKPNIPSQTDYDETIAKADNFDMGNNQAITIAISGLLSNDNYIETDSFEITNVINGTVVTEENNIVFTRNTEFSGVENNGFDYKIGSATAHVKITGNLAPVAVTDEVTTSENQSITISADYLLGNDFDPNPNDNITITEIGTASNANIQIINNALIFTPINTGNASFEYTITDEHGASATGLVLIDVIAVVVINPVNAVNDEFNTVINDSLPITIDSLLANDSGDNLTIIDAKIIENGKLEYNGDIIFTPEQVGTAKFVYTVQDNYGATDTATVTISIDDIENSQPIATDDIVSIANSPIKTTILLANDSDEDSDKIEIIAVSDNAQLVDSEIIFTSDFTYTISDGELTDTANVIVENRLELTWDTESLVFKVSDQPISIEEAEVYADSLDFSDGTLQVAITKNRTSNDFLRIENSDSISVSSNTNGNILHNDTNIGSFTTNFITGALLINFNAAANTDSIEELIQAITYQNISPEPELDSNRILKLSLSNGDIETSVSREIQLVTENIEPIAQDDDILLDFNVYTKIPVNDLLQNDVDTNPTDIIRVSEVNSTDDRIDVNLVDNEVQIFIDGLIGTDSAKFEYVLEDGEGGEDEATVTVYPTNMQTGTDGNDTFDGTENNDIIAGGAGDDVFKPSNGTDILLGEEGDDTFYLTPNTTGIYIDGGTGIDKISLGGTGDQSLNLVQNRNLPESSQLKLQGIDKIDITGKNNQLYLQVQDVLEISDQGDKLIIDGGAGNMVNSFGQGWNSNGTDGLYNIYVNSTAELLVNIEINNQFIS